VHKLLLACLLLCCAPAAFAERADRDKPVHLEADQVLIDDAKQVSTFTGNVQMIQGTMLLRGDKLVVVQDKDGFRHGTTYGRPASFRQKREGLDEYVEGYGERIEYDVNTETVDFYVQARVKRNLDEVRGEHITYNSKTETFQVNGISQDSESRPRQRVRAVLQPKPKPDTATPPSPGSLLITPSETLTPASQ
jgi:lipopolysaccharide export system protein LptA